MRRIFCESRSTLWIYMFDAGILCRTYLPRLDAVARITLTDRRIESRALRIRDIHSDLNDVCINPRHS